MSFKEYIGWFFKDDSGYPSMMRLLSFINGIAGIVFGILMMVHARKTGQVNQYEFYLSAYFSLLAVVGKQAQKIVEWYIDKKS